MELEDRKWKEILEQKDKYIEELRKDLEWHSEKVQEYGTSLHWHICKVKELEDCIEEKENEFEEKRKKDKQEILELRKKIFEMENSRSWVWTKFLRRDKK